ncbi:MAG TPA: PDZ domain-containing protein [Gemmatimonadales bacterium]|nr:PDZ domain-containing protein [Gemmatimonadales bacterium]
MRRIGTTLACLLLALPVRAQSPTDTTRPQPATTGYGAWFGSVPDMDATEAGITLAGVSDSSPAAKAGLRKGDRIVAMAGAPVVDLRAMVEVLRAHPPGETIEVVYMRDFLERKVKVTLGKRPGG